MSALIEHSGHILNILGVEDNPLLAMQIKKTFEAQNCICDMCSTGEELLQRLTPDSKYDVVLLDLGLPGIDGFEVADRIRHRADAIADIPIIALTSHHEKDVAEHARQVGINGFLVKPLSAMKCRMLLHDFKCRH